MAKKKRNPKGGKPKRTRRAPDRMSIPDRRAMEGIMHELVGQLQGAGNPDTPLAQAQELMYEAFEAPSEKQRIRLARQALEISPDCADAYVLLAENALSRKEALELYEKGVEAGERALGPQAFQEDVGHFWGMLETRPYMRARQGLAFALWTSGRRDEAVQHLQDMLRLNPNDNQGLRYTLAGFLFFLDRDDDLVKLLQQFPDDGMATWAYTRALLAFRQQGDAPESQKLLKQALKTNKHVPFYLLGEKFPPQEPPGSYSPGDESEALNYIGGFLAAWKSTPGAIDWLRAHVPSKRKKRPPAPQPKGPLSLVKNWLTKHLPQTDSVWQADFRQLPAWIIEAGERIRPWMVLVMDQSNELLLTHDLPEEEPSAAFLWDVLVKAMREPMAGNPHRPSELRVRANERWTSLRSHLEEIGIALVENEELEQLAEVFGELGESLFGKPEPGLLDMPGIKPEQIGPFYEAAASFYQQTPWKKVGYEAAIKVECDQFQSGPWYAVLMGQSGLTMGLTLYEDLNILKRMWTGNYTEEENARMTVATTVLYGDESEIPPADLEAIQRYHWPVARPDAYPSIFHKERGLSSRPPLAWEIELMESCLRAVPDFVNRRSQDDPTTEEITVPVASGERKLRLSWVVDDQE